jgi:hypothetical protein
MSEITITVPDGTPEALELPPAEAAQEVRMAAAAKLFELGRLSSGAAARLAGVPRAVFLARLADYGVVTFRETREELLEDLSNA